MAAFSALVFLLLVYSRSYWSACFLFPPRERNLKADAWGSEEPSHFFIAGMNLHLNSNVQEPCQYFIFVNQIESGCELPVSMVESLPGAPPP